MLVEDYFKLCKMMTLSGLPDSLSAFYEASIETWILYLRRWQIVVLNVGKGALD